jgi:SAM-dependent methyltransferase
VNAASTPRFSPASAESVPWSASLWTCAACGLCYLDADAPEGGGQDLCAPAQALRRLGAGRRASWIARHLARGARVLDVGAGAGLLLDALARRGFDVQGLELDAARARSALPAARVEAGTLAQRFEELASAPPFDAVVFWHTLEHHREPFQELRRAHALLAPAGALFVAVPNAASFQAGLAGPAWLHLDLPHHRFHFSPQSLGALARDAGFTLESLRTGQWEMDLPGCIEAQASLLGLPRRFVFDAAAGARPVSPLRRLGAALFAACALPLALCESLVGRLTGRAGTLILVARSTPPAESP